MVTEVSAVVVNVISIWKAYAYSVWVFQMPCELPHVTENFSAGIWKLSAESFKCLKLDV